MSEEGRKLISELNPFYIKLAVASQPKSTGYQARDLWWKSIVGTYADNKLEVGRLMLKAYKAAYGVVPYDLEDLRAAKCEDVEQPLEHQNERPKRQRTASLIAGNDEPSRPEKSEEQPRLEKPQKREREIRDLVDPESDIVFVDKQFSNSNLLQLSSGINKRMTKLQSYVPLTVFNMEWIDADSQKASNKKTKSLKELQEEESATYTGLTPKEELLLTYGDWIDAIDLFIRYVEEQYHMKTCAKMLKEHKKNVIEIRRSTGCWMIALRYCMKVRQLVMQVRIGESGKREMCRAGVLHEDILRAAKDKAESLGERSFAENPYAAGQKVLAEQTVQMAIQPTAPKLTGFEKHQFASGGNARGGGSDRGGVGWRGRGKRQKNNLWDKRNNGGASYFGAPNSVFNVPNTGGTFGHDQPFQPAPQPAPYNSNPFRPFSFPNQTQSYGNGWSDHTSTNGAPFVNNYPNGEGSSTSKGGANFGGAKNTGGAKSTW
ncbi:uncharacterized protein MELLADRAFT_84539 [Melampsora larici-populina 98AG31]|uniref:Uncharacterized protein n=1 Tax=Melampsora larici-populina (strain 98AG31 / pathotype 3-4-7) TaxID=747676 RepID=F4SCD5_MELLP|nr:uncharacterized protein MELLADRAFT_84539 [Melampsora larici-populina 98AG31]EGF97677.1 hypothetical protein MELLADRAFT_84539 [Melampsora larici-populina 98AG31]